MYKFEKRELRERKKLLKNQFDGTLSRTILLFVTGQSVSTSELFATVFASKVFNLQVSNLDVLLKTVCTFAFESAFLALELSRAMHELDVAFETVTSIKCFVASIAGELRVQV